MKKTTKNLKNLLTNLWHLGPHKTTSRTACGSLGLCHANPFIQKTFNLTWILLQRILLCNWELRL